MRKLAAVVIAIALVVAAALACFPQNQCSGTFTEYCATTDNCQGHIIDATHWESGPKQGTWVNYGHEDVLLMHFRDHVTGAELSGDVASYQILVAAVPEPDTPGNNFAPCAGNLCEITDNDDSSLFVKNDTCADYFVHVYVTLNAPSAADAGTE